MAEKIDFTQIAGAGYNSDFDSDAETRKRKLQYESLLPQKKTKKEGKPNYQELGEQYTKEEGKIHRLHYLSMSAFDRHKQFVNNYVLYFGGNMKDFKRDTSKDRNDMDVIRENHQFLWDEDEDDSNDTWEKRLAKKYYDKLFKEYCLADLSRYKENKVGMRWRTENEVVEGKGQFKCGSKKCPEEEGLRSWEVNFAYVEHGEKKNALVKLRLCPDCSYKLNYHHRRKEVLPPNRKKEKKDKRHKKHKKHKKGRRAESSDDEGAAEGEGSGQKGAEKDDKAQPEETNIWSRPAKITEEKSREEEFEDYFADMFL